MAELNLYQKLAKIRKPVEVLAKNKQGYGYKYVTEDAILEKITGLMSKLGVSLIPGICSGMTTVTPYQYTKTKTAKNGDQIIENVNEILVQGEMVWKWVNDDNPTETIEVPWAFVGQQSDASQAFGSGLTYSSRYFLMKYFNVATPDDDPDNWRSRQKEAETLEDRGVAEEIIKQVETIIHAHLEKVPDDRDAILKTVQSHIKKAGKKGNNYFVIDNPDIARELLNEINKLTTKEKK